MFWFLTHQARLNGIIGLFKSVSCKSRISTFLDAGCAEGLYLRLASSIFGEACQNYGLDIARSHLIKSTSQHEPIWSLIQGDIEHLPFRSNTIDFVLCSEVLEHVSKWETALAELARVSNAYLLISFPGETLADLLLRIPSVRLKRKLNRDFRDKTHNSDLAHLHEVDGHISHPTINAVKSHLKKEGMVIQDETYFQTIPPFIYAKLPFPENMRLRLYRLDHTAISTIMKRSLREFLSQRLILARKPNSKVWMGRQKIELAS